MARHNIAFIEHLFGSYSAGIKRVVLQAYTQHPARKIVVCTNSNTNTEITLTSLAESVLNNHITVVAVIALTGECGHWILSPASPVMVVWSGLLLLL